ncbi:MAG: YbgC/FadM family acyl-CoA thioesterase [Burkholderiales bacterium]|nr:YbgC/FadM family acyl-CoA thioesterase [Pseudomonadota bacterium]
MAIMPVHAASREREDGLAFAWPVTVYYEDTDTLGMVYHSNYLKYFERARVEWLNAIDVNLPKIAAAWRQAFVVHRVNIEYLKPAALGDRLHATVEVLSVRSCFVELRQTVRRGAELLTQAEVRIVYVDLDKLKPVILPDAVRSQLKMTSPM